MPELPDISLYTAALAPRVIGQTLESVTIKSPFLVRTFDPPPDAGVGRRVRGVGRLGKRIVLHLDEDLHYVIHLMIAGRLLWKPAGARPAGRIDLAAFGFSGGLAGGTLVLTEASPKKRASLHIVRGAEALAALDPGGIDPLGCSAAAFGAALAAQNRTLKRALTDPRTFSGIGNAYSDEILHAAKLSPVKLTGSLKPEEVERLHGATTRTLHAWIDKLRREFGVDDASLKMGEIGRFPGPGDVTAFRPDFAVHGRFGKPCPVCGSPVQRIVRGDHETNYCATCQTGGKLLADRSLSRLLKDDWPATVEEWERELGGSG